MKETRENIRKELKEAGSKLGDLSDPDMLIVPEGYFDQLESDILRATIFQSSTQVNNKGKVVRLIWIKYAATIAAVFVLVFFGLKLINQKNEASIEMQLAGMSDQELELYMTEQVATITAEDLHQYITQHIDEIDAGLFAETELISDELTQMHFIDESDNETISDVNETNNQQLLDKELLDQLDDKTIEQLLNDETMFDDFCL